MGENHPKAGTVKNPRAAQKAEAVHERGWSKTALSKRALCHGRSSVKAGTLHLFLHSIYASSRQSVHLPCILGAKNPANHQPSSQHGLPHESVHMWEKTPFAVHPSSPQGRGEKHFFFLHLLLPIQIPRDGGGGVGREKKRIWSALQHQCSLIWLWFQG